MDHKIVQAIVAEARRENPQGDPREAVAQVLAQAQVEANNYIRHRQGEQSLKARAQGRRQWRKHQARLVEMMKPIVRRYGPVLGWEKVRAMIERAADEGKWRLSERIMTICDRQRLFEKAARIVSLENSPQRLP